MPRIRTRLRILLDQNMPRPLARLLPGHDVTHASARGWAELGNGDLIEAAERDGFGLLLTGDCTIRYQQSLNGRLIALLVLSSNNLHHLTPQAALITDAVNRAAPGSYEDVQIARPPLLRRPPPTL